MYSQASKRDHALPLLKSLQWLPVKVRIDNNLTDQFQTKSFRQR